MATWLRRRFVSLQVPFADLRSARPEGGRLSKPSWPDPEVGQEFIRGVGVVTARRLGGSPIWLGESAFCNFSRMVKIEPADGFRTIYQRCYGTKWGYRLDIGLVFDRNSLRGPVNLELRNVAASLLNQQAAIRNEPSRPLKTQLATIGRVIEAQTQKHSNIAVGQLRVGNPLVLVEDLLGNSKIPTVGLSQVVSNQRPVDILHVTRPSARESEEARRQVRLMRLAWWRAHSELEALRIFLRAWNNGDIRADQPFRDLLDGMGGDLARWRRHGVNQAQVIAWRSTQHPDELDYLQSMADLLLAESQGIARKVRLIVERARDTEAAAELLGKLDPSQPLNLSLFEKKYEVHAQGSNGIAIGDDSKVIYHPTDLERDDMDPISIVIAALVAGAATGATKVAGEAIGDAYNGFKSLLKRAFSRDGDQDAENTVEKLEQTPQSDQAALRASLEARNVGDDKELIEAARKVLAKVDPNGYRSGKYDVKISDSQGVQVGDYGTQTNTFNNK